MLIIFCSKPANVKNESEEDAEIKNDITVGASTPEDKPQIKRKLSINADHTKKIKNSIKKKKSLSHNWKVIDI